jgi:hypothetical protein
MPTHPCTHPFYFLAHVVFGAQLLSSPASFLNLGFAQQYTCYRKPTQPTHSFYTRKTQVSRPFIRSFAADLFRLEQTRNADRQGFAENKEGAKEEFRANIKRFEPTTDPFWKFAIL